MTGTREWQRTTPVCVSFHFTAFRFKPVVSYKAEV